MYLLFIHVVWIRFDLVYIINDLHKIAYISLHKILKYRLHHSFPKLTMYLLIRLVVWIRSDLVYIIAYISLLNMLA